MEIFKEIEGYERYQVSNFGNIKSFAKNKDGKLLKPSNRNGYLSVELVNGEGKGKRFSIHRLVALAFIPNPENKPQVNHIDENKCNNNSTIS